MTNRELPRDTDGKLSAYAWPGGYPIVYYCQDGGELCPACANGENGSEAQNPECQDDPQWHVVAADVYWEGPPVPCDHCGTEIASAYGDPEDELAD